MSTHPESWAQFNLGKVADVTWGDTSTTKKSYVDDGYTAFSASGPDGFLDHYDYDQTGIVVSAIGAQCGKIWKASGKWSCIKNTMRILPNSDAVSIDYLFQFLSIDAFPKRGTGQPFIRQQDARAIPVPIPPLPEQQRIVDILEEQFSRLDAALASIRTVRAKAASFRRSLLRQTFGNVTHFGEIDDWEYVRLGDAGRWLGGGTPSKSEPSFWADGDVPWVSPKDMKQLVLADSEDHITRDAVANSSVRIVAPGSVAVVVRSGILERCLPVALIPFESTLNQDMKAVEPHGNVRAKWLLYAIQGAEYQILKTCRKSGTTVASIEWSAFSDYEIPLVSLPEQDLIIDELEDRLSRQDAVMAIADQLEARIAAERRSLLHAAFSGSLTAQWRKTHHG